MVRSVINILDLSVEEIQDLIQTACDIIDHPRDYDQLCRGK